MTVLIPAFEPDMRLIALLHTLAQQDLRIVVVDDGSGQGYTSVFEQARTIGCTILTHPTNLGKGCALKTGFSYILENMHETEGVITADADGQHLPIDILHVAEELRQTHTAIVLGARRFTGHVPARSVFGNLVMRAVFAFASGRNVWDTQTGLRGIPAELLPLLLRVRGARFEYEINMLLDLANAGYKFQQIFIDTVYTSGNATSHFRPLVDSVRVLLPTLRFCVSSIAAAVTDYILLFVFQWLTHSLLLGVVLARASSSGVQYVLNRSLVFHSRLTNKKQPHRAAQYYLLVLGLLGLNYLILKVLTGPMHIWLVWAKLVTEMILFFVSYLAQRLLVFKHPVIN
ncbi:MAG: GtrA family protein [Ethanoligenens sp.]